MSRQRDQPTGGKKGYAEDISHNRSSVDVEPHVSEPDETERIAQMERDGVDDIRTKKKISSRDHDAQKMYLSDKEDLQIKAQQTDRSEEMKTDRPLIENTSNSRRDAVFESSRRRDQSPQKKVKSQQDISSGSIRNRENQNFVKKQTLMEKARDTLLGPSPQEERNPANQRKGDIDAIKDITQSIMEDEKAAKHRKNVSSISQGISPDYFYKGGEKKSKKVDFKSASSFRSNSNDSKSIQPEYEMKNMIDSENYKRKQNQHAIDGIHQAMNRQLTAQEKQLANLSANQIKSIKKVTNYGNTKKDGESTPPEKKLDPFQFTDQVHMTRKRQSDFRKILGIPMKQEMISVNILDAILDDPEKYYDDNEEIDSVQMEVLKEMQKQMTSQYKQALCNNKVDIKMYGLKPEEKEELDKYQQQMERSSKQRNILYLTNRKKKYGVWDRIYDTICCCCPTKDESFDEEEAIREQQVEVNMKVIDMLIFSENNSVYQVFNIMVSFLCLFSSYLYLYIAAFRFSDIIEEKGTEKHVPYFFYTLIIEVVFLFYFSIQFFKEFTPVGQGDRSKPVREWSKIFFHYMTTEFFWDFIPLIPLQFFKLYRHRERLFFLIKCIRLKRGFQILDVTKLKGSIKEYFNSRLEKNIEEDEEFANNKLEQKNPVESLLFIGYALKTLYLTIVIVNISYIMGMVFYVLCEFIQDFILDTDYRNIEDPSDYEPENFISYNALYDRTPAEIAIVVTYYMFTSLSTVGFGDYNPRSNFERVFIALVLLFGVAIFSYIMGNFQDILSQFKSYNDDIEEGDMLNKFLGVLVKFNGHKDLDLEFQEKIEQYFHYKWNNDQNAAFREQLDLDIFTQLPDVVRESIYKDFLFSQFLKKFKRTFEISNMINPNQNSFYTWYNQVYRDFMIDIMQALEPIRIEKNTKLFIEQEEMTEVYFFMKGIFEIGFSINLSTIFTLRYQNYSVIGAYAATFFKRSAYIYKTFTECRGYFIRRKIWQNILERNDIHVVREFKDQIVREYEIKIKRRMNYCKLKEVQKQAQRADFQTLKFMQGIEDEGILRSNVKELRSYNHKVTSTAGFDIKGFLPASLDAKKAQQEISSCDESQVCSEEICCVFDNNIDDQEKYVVNVLKKFDQCHEDRLYYIQKSYETEEQLKKQIKENQALKKQVQKLEAENQEAKEKIVKYFMNDK